MAELANVTDRRVSAAGQTIVMGWSRPRAYGLIGLAAALGMWTALAPSWWAAAGALGVVAIFASRAWPRILGLVLFGLLPNNVTWAVFLGLRGYADASPWTDSVRLLARRFEVWLFAGEMPTTRLQRAFFDPNQVRPWDYFMAAVHVSFYYVPTIVMLRLWWANRALFRRLLTALVLTLGLGLIGFLLLPSNPPWMNPESGDTNPVPVYRINYVIGQAHQLESFQGDGGLKAETNPLAAMPSIHFAVTFLLLLAALGRRRRWVVLAAIDVALMGLALVYLGEHQVVDEAAGAALATLAWWWSPAVLARVERHIGVPAIATVAAVKERLRDTRSRKRWRFGLFT